VDAWSRDDLHCENCGYHLRGLVSDSCPECGYSVELSARGHDSRRVLLSAVRLNDIRTGLLLITLGLVIVMLTFGAAILLDVSGLRTAARTASRIGVMLGTVIVLCAVRKCGCKGLTLPHLAGWAFVLVLAARAAISAASTPSTAHILGSLASILLALWAGSFFHRLQGLCPGKTWGRRWCDNAWKRFVAASAFGIVARLSEFPTRTAGHGFQVLLICYVLVGALVGVVTLLSAARKAIPEPSDSRRQKPSPSKMAFVSLS